MFQLLCYCATKEVNWKLTRPLALGLLKVGQVQNASLGPGTIQKQMPTSTLSSSWVTEFLSLYLR